MGNDLLARRRRPDVDTLEDRTLLSYAYGPFLPASDAGPVWVMQVVVDRPDYGHFGGGPGHGPGFGPDLMRGPGPNFDGFGPGGGRPPHPMMMGGHGGPGFGHGGWNGGWYDGSGDPAGPADTSLAGTPGSSASTNPGGWSAYPAGATNSVSTSDAPAGGVHASSVFGGGRSGGDAYGPVPGGNFGQGHANGPDSEPGGPGGPGGPQNASAGPHGAPLFTAMPGGPGGGPAAARAALVNAPPLPLPAPGAATPTTVPAAPTAVATAPALNAAAPASTTVPATALPSNGLIRLVLAAAETVAAPAGAAGAVVAAATGTKAPTAAVDPGSTAEAAAAGVESAETDPAAEAAAPSTAADFITGFLPFDRTGLEASLEQFLEQLDDASRTVETAAPPWPRALVVVSAGLALEAARRWRARRGVTPRRDWRQYPSGLSGLS